MTERPPLWADILLTLWVLAVAAFFFGGYFLPALVGPYTQAGAALYALMLLLSAGTLAWNYLRRADVNTEGAKNDRTNSTRMKD